MTETDEEYAERTFRRVAAQDEAMKLLEQARRAETERQTRIDETVRALAAVQFTRTNYLSRDHVADIYNAASELEAGRERFVELRRKAGHLC